MPVIISAKNNQSTSDVIRQFKKAMAATPILDDAKERRYHQKPSAIKAQKTASMSKNHRRYRSLKKMKNVSPRLLASLLNRPLTRKEKKY